MYLWQVAGVEKIPYTEDNIALLKNIVSQCQTQEADNPKLKEEGHEMYYYVESAKRFNTNEVEKEIKLSKKAKVENRAEYDKIKLLEPSSLAVGRYAGPGFDAP